MNEIELQKKWRDEADKLAMYPAKPNDFESGVAEGYRKCANELTLLSIAPNTLREAVRWIKELSRLPATQDKDAAYLFARIEDAATEALAATYQPTSPAR